MKKTLAIVLALVMILSLATAASAASITITPPTVPEGATESGITYTAYKIFDATITYGTDGKTIEKVSYTISTSSPYYEVVSTQLTDYFELTDSASDSTVKVVTAKDAYTETTAATVAAVLANVTNDSGKISLTNQADGTYKADNLDAGYYLVTSSVGSALILDTIGDVTIATKNTYPTLEKKVEGAESTTADKGAVLNFTIDVTIPANAVGEIVVHDKMTGLDYQNWTTTDGITAAAADLSDGCAVHFTLSAEFVNTNKGKTVTISYTAKVTADVANNEAWLVDSTYTSKPDSTTVYSTDVVISKVDGSNNETMLSGAKFVLAKKVNNVYSYYSVDSNGIVFWVAAQTSATVVTTDDNGYAEFTDIADGTYYLIETEAPAGYNLLKDPVEVTVKAELDTTTTSIKDVTQVVQNNSGTELPSTGGIGTTLFYIFGGILVVGAVVLLVTKKRMNAA